MSAPVRVRFMVYPRKPSGRLLDPVESPTVWEDCRFVPRHGDTTLVEHDGNKTAFALCRTAAITWEGDVQVFTVRVEVGS